MAAPFFSTPFQPYVYQVGAPPPCDLNLSRGALYMLGLDSRSWGWIHTIRGASFLDWSPHDLIRFELRGLSFFRAKRDL